MEFTPSREGQLTEKQMKYGYWWVNHKLQLKVLLTVAIGITGVVLVTYSIYGFADWFYGSGVKERADIGNMATAPTGYLAIHQKNAPQEVFFDNTAIILSGSGAYDIYTRANNPNTDWLLDLEWHFEIGGEPTGDSRKVTLLPNDIRLLTQLAYKSDDHPGQAELILDSKQWRRLDKHKVRPDYATWSAERLDLRVKDIDFSPPAPDDLLTVSRATFKVTNSTGYGYWRTGFHVVLWEGIKMVGVNYVTVSELMPGETRSVDASWFTALPVVNRVEVIPDINIFDDSVYVPVGR